MAEVIPPDEMVRKCHVCQGDMPLGDYGRVYQCGCGTTTYRYPKPVTLTQAIDNMHNGLPPYHIPETKEP